MALLLLLLASAAEAAYVGITDPNGITVRPTRQRSHDIFSL